MILTIGHSAHPAAGFGALLTGAGVDVCADVRRTPFSRRHPQFRREELQRWLPPRGVAYRYLGEHLGGQRAIRDAAAHPALEPGFAGYAAHMSSDAFRLALRDVLALTDGQVVALMCAEADPTRCHRWLLSDALVLLEGTAVSHISRDGSVRPHVPSSAARVEAGRLVYDVAVDRPLPFA